MISSEQVRRRQVVKANDDENEKENFKKVISNYEKSFTLREEPLPPLSVLKNLWDQNLGRVSSKT